MVVDGDENEQLTSVGSSSAMGRMLREHWIPALRAERIGEPDSPPVRVRLLGENFVAFRATDGTIGFFDEACPHRGASLALARNEDCSLTCIYHGWRFDVSGKLLETPSEPGDRAGFRNRVEVGHYPAVEAGGIVWVWLGANRSAPRPAPRFGFWSLPPEQVFSVTAVVECNWLQVLEADLDAAHVSILHQTEAASTHLRDTTEDAAPRSEFDYHPWGFFNAAVRDAGGKRYLRIKPLILPWYTIVPPSPEGDYLWHAFVPIDDVTTLSWYLWYNKDRPIDTARFAPAFGLGLDEPDFDPDNFRRGWSIRSSFDQDRAGMKENTSFSGIDGIALQDIAIVESMGPLVDRSREHLGVGDAAIARLRALLLKSVRTFAAGDLPPSLEADVDYGAIESEALMLGDEDWRTAMRARTAVRL
ncbi:MAG: Rieske 2Fe-2S domain-containing protein [Actinomycetota bacterium]|nr:Rieske 2Fe-2S domain-containing protein [Actinomycetota bacterium]